MFFKKIFSKSRWVFLVFFFLVLIFFFFNNSYYIPSELSVTTSAEKETEARFYWDTGAGFNERESIDFRPFESTDFDNKTHKVEIKRLETTNSISKGSEVWIEEIQINEKNKINIDKLVGKDSFINDNNKLAINKVNSSIFFEESFEKLNIIFFTHQWAGKVQVTIDGKDQIYDLYSLETKSRNIPFYNKILPSGKLNNFVLPQTEITALKIVFSDPSAKIEKTQLNYNSKSELIKWVQESDSVFINKSSLNTAQFNILLFVVQFLGALIISYIVYSIYKYFFTDNIVNFRDKINFIFIRNGVFWIMFSISFIVFLLWLIGQWPGVMTVDSYHFTWREIKTLKFENVTPWIYNIYILLLTQIIESPFIIALFQIIVTSLLGSTMFYFLYKNGANKIIIILCFIAFIFSIPIGIYNITLWKDIPFTQAMLFWGFIIFYLYYMKKHKGVIINVKYSKVLICSLILILLATFRHNGIIFIIIIPLILFIFRLLNKRNFVQFIITTFVFFTIYITISPFVTNIETKEVSSFFSKTYRVGPLAAIYTKPHSYLPELDRDKELIEKWMSQEELNKYYTPVSQADTVGYMVSKWMQMNEVDQQRLNKLFYIRTLQNIDVFISDRFAMFLGTMGFSSKIFITTNELNNAEYDKSFWRPVEAYKFTKHTINEWLTSKTEYVYKASRSFRGQIPISPLIFNTTIPLLLLLTAFYFYKYFSATALYSFIFLINLPVLFLVLSTAEWRYMYFLLLSSFFILPMMSLERNTVKKNKIVS